MSEQEKFKKVSKRCLKLCGMLATMSDTCERMHYAASVLASGDGEEPKALIALSQATEEYDEQLKGYVDYICEIESEDMQE
jgi:hypothetical protein